MNISCELFIHQLIKLRALTFHLKIFFHHFNFFSDTCIDSNEDVCDSKHYRMHEKLKVRRADGNATFETLVLFENLS